MAKRFSANIDNSGHSPSMLAAPADRPLYFRRASPSTFEASAVPDATVEAVNGS
jgi:hypothetical protein